MSFRLKCPLCGADIPITGYTITRPNDPALEAGAIPTTVGEPDITMVLQEGALSRHLRYNHGAYDAVIQQ